MLQQKNKSILFSNSLLYKLNIIMNSNSNKIYHAKIIVLRFFKNPSDLFV